SSPRWRRPAARAPRKRASAIEKDIQQQLRLKGGVRGRGRAAGAGLDSARNVAFSHSAPQPGVLPPRRRARMARIDYDEDDHDDDGSPRLDWRRTLLTWALAAVGLGLGFLVPYMLYLNHQVNERFGQLQWQQPTRVYARPLALAPGTAMDAAT